MKEELLKMAQECLSEEEVKEILKKKFKESIESAIGSAFRWGDAEKALKKKINDVMVPYIEKYDFSEYLPKLDTVLTEIVNSDACIENKKILENFKELSIKQKWKSRICLMHGLQCAKRRSVQLVWKWSLTMDHTTNRSVARC